ncbi:hypothetical protein [Streptomyces goshikiensis]|uniref:hypothetical protein n=1 Tax=Streptomyces goshikiensis TaxID=1942 RepID=UPI0033A6D2EA
MKRGTEPYDAALDAMIIVLQRWAREGRKNGWYSALSAELQALGHPVHHRSKTMSELLADVCHREWANGAPMLSVIVVNKTNGTPSGQFFELAKAGPFHRTDSDWSWERERSRVFAHYSQS